MIWRDLKDGYGLISIALHWISAAAILVLLFVGDSIAVSGEPARRLHTSIALAAWLMLAVRIGWRLFEGHPQIHGSAPSAILGMVVHYVLLLGVALMLVSGPLAALTSGAGLGAFGLVLGADWGPRPIAHAAFGQAHAIGAGLLVAGTLLHVGGVLKHMLFDRDHLLDRILVPGAAPRSTAAD